MSDKGRSWRQTKGRPEFIGIDFPGGRAPSSHEEPIIRMDSGADRPAGAVE